MTNEGDKGNGSSDLTPQTSTVPYTLGRARVIAPRVHLGKLVAPQQPKDVIRRKRLINQLLDSDKPLILLIAPAGYGKTVLMSQLHEMLVAQSHPVAWMSLDDRDNDFSRFMIYLREAILRLSLFTWPLGSTSLDTSQSAFSDLRAEAFELIDMIASTDRPFTLFVDAFETVYSAEVIGFINDLVRSLNSGQRILIGSRAMRILPAASLEVSGHLTRIEPDNLLFDVDEASAFFAKQTKLRLTGQDIALLQNKTEGWPAALRLFTLALPAVADTGNWIKSLSGPTQSITRYLAENVLAQLPEHLSKFVLRTSILDQLYSNLCNALLEQQDCARLLDEIYSANLFLTLHDASLGIYEFHSLFRSFLSSELTRLQPDIVPVLHRRASVFLCSSGLYADALHHAFQSQDDTLVVDILDLCVLRFVELGQLETVCKWLDRVDASIIVSKPNIQRARAYAMTAIHRYPAAMDALDNLRKIAEEHGRELDLEATVQLALLHEWMDHHDFSAEDANRLAEQIGADQYLPYSIARNVAAFRDICYGNYILAQQALDAATAAYHHCGFGNWPSTYTACFQGALEMILGNMRSGIQRFETGLAQAATASQSVLSAYLADALYEKDELARAGSLAEEHLRLNREVAPPDIVILSYRTAARVCFLNGNLDRAELLLTELGDVGDLRDIQRLKAAAWLEKSKLALLCGDTESASRYHKLGTNPKIWDAHKGAHYYPMELDDPAIASMRMELLLGDPDLAASQLANAISEAGKLGRRWRRIRLQTLLVQAHARLRRRKTALDLLEDALVSAAPNGMIHVFADEPWYLDDLLKELQNYSRRIDSTYLGSVINAVTLVANRIGELITAKTQHNLLTLKETSILSLVAAGKANKEIARILGITDNTVETHLRKINLKLDTHNRTQAVAKGREIGLLR